MVGIRDKEKTKKEVQERRKDGGKKRLPGITAVFLAICAALLFTACGGDRAADAPQEGSADRKTADAPQEGSADTKAADGEQPVLGQREWVYVPEVITVEDPKGGYVDYAEMQLVGDTFCYVLQDGDTEDSGKRVCRYSLTDRTLESAPLRWAEGGKSWDRGARFFGQDQSLYMTANVYSADYSSMKRFLCKFDREGNCLFSTDITAQAGRGNSIDRMTVDRQGRIYIFTMDSMEILLYNEEGEYQGAVAYGSTESPEPVEIRGVCYGAGGKYYVCTAKRSLDPKEGTRCSLMEIDYDGAKLTEAAGNLPDIKGICTGVDYDFLIYDQRAVYGYNLSSQNGGEELYIWLDSDINGYYVTQLCLLEDGRLCAVVEDYFYDDKAIVALEKTRADLAPKREELVMGTVDGGSFLTSIAVKFNRGNSRYHLTVKEYDSLTDLYNAMLAKKQMDLIDLSGLNVRELASRGLFEDLTPWLKQSELFGTADFVEGILDAYTFDGLLTGIPASFHLLSVAGSGAQPENKTGLTLQGLLAAADSHPEARTFDEVTRDEMLQYLMMFNQDTFIDWDTGVCRFDSEEFRAMLEYVGQFPKEQEDGGEDEPSLPTKVQNGEVLFVISTLNTLSGISETDWMFGGDAAWVGFPTPEGKGGHLLFTNDAYAIAAVSERKEGAWKFIEEFLAQEKNELYYRVQGNFSTLRDKLNQRVEESVEKDARTPADEFPRRIYRDGAVFQFHALTWDEVNRMLELIPEATPFFSVEDNEIIRIISEEAYDYYSGQKGIKEVADTIQNRVNLYVNENR